MEDTVESKLTNPGYFQITQENNGDWKVSYFSRYGEKETRLKEFFISVKDFEGKFNKNKAALAKFVDRGLKIIIAWDFDLTLSKIHTFYRGVDEPSKQLRTPQKTKGFFERQKKEARVIPIICSNGWRKTIDEYIDVWFPDHKVNERNYIIHGMIARGERPESSKANKIIDYASTKLTKANFFEKDGRKYLQVENINEDVLIDVVEGYLFDDDDRNNEQCENTGINFVKVNPPIISKIKGDTYEHITKANEILDNLDRQRIECQKSIADPLSCKEMIKYALEGISTYQLKDRSSNQSHLSFWARKFDNKRGLRRSSIYQKALQNEDLDEKQKMIALYALLSSKDGKTLKADVSASLQSKSSLFFGDNIEATCKSIADIICGLYEIPVYKKSRTKDQTESLDSINKTIGKIVAFANESSNKAEKMQVSGDIFDSVTVSHNIRFKLPIG